jgi:DNA-binding CsgD family transcriptional regulator
VRNIFARYREDRLPILTPRGAYQAHAGKGLNVLHLFTGIALEGGETETLLFMDAAIESLWKRMRGLKCQRVLGEAYGPVFIQWCVSGGYTIVNDYGEFFRQHPELRPPEALRPALLAATAEDARRSFGSRISPVFRYVRPTLGFSPSEQAMLRLALGGDTDEELAQHLGISVWTVKKRWRLVYDRVTSTMPELLDSGSHDCADDEKGRGAERRRHLLAFLRDHFEELCSVDQWPTLGQDGETLRR